MAELPIEYLLALLESVVGTGTTGRLPSYK
jgi:hypothetical protein